MDNDADDHQSAATATGWRKYTFVEPPLFIILFMYGMTGTIITDLMIFQSCRTIFLTNKTVCDILRNKSSSQDAYYDIDKMVQPHASYILLCQSLIEGILPAFLSLFLGPWSDKYGRKPLLIVSTLAETLKFILWSILSQWDCNPWLFLITSIPSTLLCGGSSLFLATYSYIADITSIENRAWRLAWLNSCISGGLVAGSLIGPLINEKFGYMTLFIITAILGALSMLHVILWVPETIKNRTDTKWGNPLNFKFVKEMIISMTKKRPGLNRWTIWSGVFVLSLYVVVQIGQINIGYLFFNIKFGWDVAKYSYFYSFSILSTIVFAMFGIKIMKYAGLSDEKQALVAAVSGFSSAIMYAFMSKPWQGYLGAGFGVFIAVLSPNIRSILSKSAPQEDIGKVFSLTTFMESLMPLAGSPLYTLLYSSYMPPIFPSPVYLLSAGIFLCITSLVILIEFKMEPQGSNYRALIQED